jgi:L-alanine-DL-glutamate epimerase-like enolase superfamily enzyme
MRITRVKAIPYSKLRTKTPGWKMALSQKVHDEESVTFIRIDTDQEIFGVGVTNPGLMVKTGDTTANILELINNVLGPSMVGADPFDIEAISRTIDSIAGGAERAKAGVDVALYDLVGNALAIPVNKLIGGVVNERIRVTRLMGMYAPKEMAERTAALTRQGFTALKLKVGTTREEDVERVQRVREAVGPGVFIALDFNQACTPKEAIDRLHKMEPYDVSLVEQPVKDTDIKGMAFVRQWVRPLVMADESVNTPAEALRVIEAQAADVISLKIAKMGGILRTKKIAAMCEAAEIDYLVGTSPGSRLFGAANLHLASSLRNLSLPCEVGEFDRFLNDPCETPVIKDGFAIVPSGPGLGLKIDLNEIGLAD